MIAEHRSGMAKTRVLDLIRIASDVDMLMDALKDNGGNRFEQKAYEETVAGLEIAREALERAGRLAEANALYENSQKHRLIGQLEASVTERNIRVARKT